ncbi:MAG: hemin uptake protein HemP [Planctomycetota bacterium]|jgi:hemin uptake protein HemP|uniref:hemin uptake protein HemP n=1 Tax=uncultured Gimesia sp. TaxID=1678688 RepID=UPI00345466AA
MSEQSKVERLAPASAPKDETPADVISSDTLLKGNHEVLIQHGETIYRLRVTQNGKLILCK